MENNCCADFSFSPSFSLSWSHSYTHSVFYKDLWYSVAQSMWINQEGLLLISKDYRKWAQSPIEHFQLEVQPLCLTGVQLSSYSLTKREMEIECRYYITSYFLISVSLLMLLAELRLCSQWCRKYSDSLLKWKYQHKSVCSAEKGPCDSYVTVTSLLLTLMDQHVHQIFMFEVELIYLVTYFSLAVANSGVRFL